MTDVAQCAFSVDVEDWFHILDIPNAPGIDEWDRLPSHVERDLDSYLELMEQHNVTCTCFFLGWVAERFPKLVRRTAACGHEVASHGYRHDLVYSAGRQAFAADIHKAKDIIEDVIGQGIRGYRAPGFSVTKATPWFHDVLAEHGYTYSSSVFPSRRGHGGIVGAKLEPYRHTPSGVIELPVSVVECMRQRLCLFGGGYLRLFPYSLIRKGALRVLSANRPVIFYMHPREINPHHPRMHMPLTRRFKCYVNLKSTRPKMQKLFTDFPFVTLGELASQFHAA